jgi:hypothetical protein
MKEQLKGTIPERLALAQSSASRFQVRKAIGPLL